MRAPKHSTTSSSMVRSHVISQLKSNAHMSRPQVSSSYHKFRVRGQETPLTEFAVYTLILAIDISVGSSVRTICWVVSKFLQSWTSLFAAHTRTVVKVPEMRHLHSTAEWNRTPTTLEVVLAPHLPYSAPRTQFGVYWWRCRMRYETTFAMCGLEPWEKSLIMLVINISSVICLRWMHSCFVC